MNERDAIDLRSDTVTRPSPAMRQAMAEAQVGDDVFGDDPTVIRLQDKVADLLGKQAAIYLPSGSMANQTSIRSQTQPGDEVIAHKDSHIYHYEAGAPAGLSGCSLRLLEGERGMYDADAVRSAVRPLDSHFPQSALIIVENTHNRGGGTVWSIDSVSAIRDVAGEFGLKMHLDGARLMNACVARGCKPPDYTRYFDTVSICFSKGLGAPVGSAVAGSAETIARVHRFRKMFGGGMRQAGIIAAGALYALEHNIDRLVDDHAGAKRLAQAIAGMPGVSIDPTTVETNIVYFDVDEFNDAGGPTFQSATAGASGCAGAKDSAGARIPSRTHRSAKDLCNSLREQGVWMLPIAPQRVRAVTHLDVSAEGIDRAISVMEAVTREAASR